MTRIQPVSPATPRPLMPSEILVILLSLLMLCSCGEKKTDRTADLVTLSVKGRVRQIDSLKRSVTIAHDEIPNYMPAMTMPFRIKDTTLLASVRPGDSVSASLAVSRTESWLAGIAVVTKGNPPHLPTASDLTRLHLKEGDPLPAIELTNQDGKRIRLSDYLGKTLAITFVYTRCPLPDFCIRMSDHFYRVQEMLRRSTDIGDRWHLLSISFDPRFDTPAVLRRYGLNYGADFSHWEFATDSLSTIMALAELLGLTVEGNDGPLIDHNLRTLVVDARGNLRRLYSGNEWTAAELVEEIKSAGREL